MPRLLKGECVPSKNLELRPVPRIRGCEFQPRHVGGTPSVVVDHASNWRALKRWSPEYLKAVAGGQSVSVRRIEGAPINVYGRHQDGLMTFARYLDWVLEAGDDLREIAQTHTAVFDVMRAMKEEGIKESYYLDIPLGKLSARLVEDVEIPSWYASKPHSTVLWCGILGTSSGLHFDVYPNCNVQVYGRKHFILFPPHESRFLYPLHRLLQPAHCRFDPNVPDFDRFPLARRAAGWECTLVAGEALYIPPGWYHQVTVVSDWSLNVNFWWTRLFLQAVTTPVMRRFLLVRSLKKLNKAVRSKIEVRNRQAVAGPTVPVVIGQTLSIPRRGAKPVGASRDALQP